MLHKFHLSAQWALPILIGSCLLALIFHVRPAAATLIPITTPEPKAGSFGVEATKMQPPPTVGATIATPGNGASFSTNTITVTGICPNGLLVQVFNNGVMVGAVMCTNGSFSVQVSLFAGTNELTVLVYDDLGQVGPTTGSVTVTYTDTHFTDFGALITLTSSYGRRSAAAGNPLSWPLQLSGGTGPYAFSIDWGDGSAAELKSQALAGLVTISHIYNKAGIYRLNVKVTDKNGVSAFLQLIAVASGKVDSTPSAPNTAGTDGANASKTPPQILWIPTALALILLIPAFMLGRLSQVVSLRNKMLRDRDNYQEK